MAYKVLCLGGSNTRGVRTTRGYPEHLWSVMGPAHGNIEVHNRGIQGGRLLDVLRQVADDLHVIREPHVVVVGIPTHDAQGGGTPPNELRALLEQVIAHLLGHTSAILLAEPTPIVGAEPPVRGFGRPSRRWCAKAAAVAQATATANDLPTPIPWLGMPPELLCDGVHPGPAGYRWMAEQAVPLVRKVLSRV